MGMSELERYRATVNHRRPDRLLFHLGFTPDIEMRVREALGAGEGGDLDALFGAYSPASARLERPEDYPLPDFSGYFQDIEIPEGSRFDSNGCLHVPASEYHFTHRISPLRHATSLAEIESYPWPDYGRYGTAHIAPAVAEAHAAGRVARVHCTHMYEDAWQVRGYQEFLIDMVAEPEWAHFVLERFKERNLRAAVAAAEAGADELHTGDDVANQNALMFSLPHWRAFIRDKWAQVYAATKRIRPDIRVWYHSDGDITAIIPELIEIGVDVLNPVQPECVDVLEVKRRYGDRLVLDGTVGTQTVMPFGTADEVRACVRERVETLAGDGGLILAPTHTLEPEVPIENVLAFVEACRDYGQLS
jgi:uroporphyrinogen decarboxylase